MATLNFRKVNPAELIVSASVWRRREEPRNIWVTTSKVAIQQDCIHGLKMAAKLLSLVQTCDDRECEVHPDSFRGNKEFPVVEFEIGRGRDKKSKWLAYVAMAGSKTLLADIVEIGPGENRKPHRDRAEERARKWIGYCKRRWVHGKPVLVDQLGRRIQ